MRYDGKWETGGMSVDARWFAGGWVIDSRNVIRRAVASHRPRESACVRKSVRLAPTDVGCLWGIRTEVVADQAFPLVTGLQPWDCKSIAKASKVRILHLPPHAERAPDAMKERGLLPLQRRLPA